MKLHLIHVAVFWVAYLVILFATGQLKAMFPSQLGGQLFWGLASSAALILLTLFFLRREGRDPSQVGLGLETGSLVRFAIGLVAGCALFGLDLLIVSMTVGPIKFVRTTGVDLYSAGLTVATILALSCMEELGFRGYPLRSLVSRTGFWRAQSLVAVAFGLCHVAFGWPLNKILLGVVPSAFVFGLAATASDGLAMPIGLHAALNVAQWSFGMNAARGLWALTVDKQAEVRVAEASPIVWVALTILMTLVLYLWGKSRLRTGAAQYRSAAQSLG